MIGHRSVQKKIIPKLAHHPYENCSRVLVVRGVGVEDWSVCYTLKSVHFELFPNLDVST